MDDAPPLELPAEAVAYQAENREHCRPARQPAPDLDEPLAAVAFQAGEHEHGRVPGTTIVRTEET